MAIRAQSWWSRSPARKAGGQAARLPPGSPDEASASVRAVATAFGLCPGRAGPVRDIGFVFPRLGLVYDARSAMRVCQTFVYGR
jgi:hypothetical protein